MLNKEEVFSYLNSGVDRNGSLKKESGFKNKFPELYQEFLKVDFPKKLKNLPFKQRLWHFLKDDYIIPTCKVCGNEVSFESKSKFYGYRTYCCKECVFKDELVKEKIKETNLEKYGVEHYSQTEECKDKMKQTCLEKYNVEYYSQTKECKEKVKETCKIKYNFEHFFQTNIFKNKTKQTLLKEYGIDYYSQTEECKDKIKETNLKKYGVENYTQTKEYKIKSKKTSLEKYGVEHYSQTEECKDKMKQTCLEKYNVECYLQSNKCKEKSKQTSLEKYGVEYYSQTEEFKNILKEKHDEIQEKEYQTKKKNNSFNSSKIEEEFKEYLINNNIDFITYHKTDKYPFECDFYLPNYDLYIEINGHWTHGEHPFNPNNIEDIKLLEEWKSKCKIINGKKNQYFIAINVWSEKDPKKRQTAKENNLNYLEIFSNKINEAIEIFENYQLKK